MSAAEPVGPPVPDNGGRGAAVIPLRQRAPRQRTPHRESDRGRDRAPEQRAAAPGHRELAEHVETTFIENRMTLTDERTAAAFRLSLTIVQGMLDAANAQGIVTEEQARELRELVEGVKDTPTLL